MKFVKAHEGILAKIDGLEVAVLAAARQIFWVVHLSPSSRTIGSVKLASAQ